MFVHHSKCSRTASMSHSARLYLCMHQNAPVLLRNHVQNKLGKDKVFCRVASQLGNFDWVRSFFSLSSQAWTVFRSKSFVSSDHLSHFYPHWFIWFKRSLVFFCQNTTRVKIMRVSPLVRKKVAGKAEKFHIWNVSKILIILQVISGYIFFVSFFFVVNRLSFCECAFKMLLFGKKSACQWYIAKSVQGSRLLRTVKLWLVILLLNLEAQWIPTFVCQVCVQK